MLVSAIWIILSLPMLLLFKSGEVVDDQMTKAAGENYTTARDRTGHVLGKLFKWAMIAIVVGFLVYACTQNFSNDGRIDCQSGRSGTVC